MGCYADTYQRSRGAWCPSSPSPARRADPHVRRSEQVKGVGLTVVSEHELVARLKAGDTEAHAILERQFAGRLFGFILRQLGLFGQTALPEDAEEILNDTFYAAIVKIRMYDPARASLKAWLYTIARNKVIDHLRWKQRKSEPPVDETAEVVAFKDPRTEGGVADEMTESRKAQVKGLRAAMEELTEKDRALLQLYYFAGIPDAELAAPLGVQPQSIPMLRKRARDRLKAALSKRPEFRGCV